MFVNFIDYKLKAKNGLFLEIDRFFPSSKTCCCCGHIVDDLPLDIREWDCPLCKTDCGRDENASKNIRAEGIRILSMGGENPALAESRQRKTNKPQGDPQGKKASAGSSQTGNLKKC